VALTGVPYMANTPPTAEGTYLGTIKHVYQIDDGALNKGVGSIDIQYNASSVLPSQAAFTLADANGQNLLFGENQFRFSAYLIQNQENSASITQSDTEIGRATEIGFYGSEGNNIGGKLSVDIDLLESSIIYVPGASKSLKSRGVFATQRQ
jgi:hypothetical protein